VILLDALGASETGFQGSNSGTDEQGRPRFTFGDHTIVIDDDGNPTTPGDGVVGRLARRGHIPLGYYKDEEKTAETFPTINGERWVVPGDMAIAEADGSITLLGRGSVSINSGRREDLPRRGRVGAEGPPGRVRRRRGGRARRALGRAGHRSRRASRRCQAVAESLADHFCQKIAPYKAPKQVVHVEELVRSPSGKADYRWAKRVAEEHAGDR
jgi:3-oxocholest-4-en-26-oate---CoA ligase